MADCGEMTCLCSLCLFCQLVIRSHQFIFPIYLTYPSSINSKPNLFTHLPSTHINIKSMAKISLPYLITSLPFIYICNHSIKVLPYIIQNYKNPKHYNLQLNTYQNKKPILIEYYLILELQLIQKRKKRKTIIIEGYLQENSTEGKYILQQHMYNNSNQQQHPHSERYHTGGNYFYKTEEVNQYKLRNQHQQQQNQERRYFQNLVRVQKITKFKIYQEIKYKFQPQKLFITKLIQNPFGTITSLFNNNQQTKQQQNNTVMNKKKLTFQQMYNHQVIQNKKILEKIAQRDRYIQHWKTQYNKAMNIKPYSNTANTTSIKDLERKITNLESKLKQCQQSNANLQKQNKSLMTYYESYRNLSLLLRNQQQKYSKCQKQRDDLKQYINGAQIEETKKEDKQKQKAMKYKQKKVKVQQKFKKRMQQSIDKSQAAFYERMNKAFQLKKQIKMSNKREKSQQMRIRGSNLQSFGQQHQKIIQEQSDEQIDQIQQYYDLVQSILQETSKAQKQYLQKITTYQSHLKFNSVKIQQLNKQLADYDDCKKDLAALSPQNNQLKKHIAILKKENEILIDKINKNQQQYQFKLEKQFQIINDQKNKNFVNLAKIKNLQQQLSQQRCEINRIRQENSKLHEQLKFKQNQVQLLNQKILQLHVQIQKSNEDKNLNSIYQRQLQELKQKVQDKDFNYNWLLKNCLILQELNLSQNNAAIHDRISKKNKNLFLSMDENNQVKSMKQKIQNQSNKSLIIISPQFFLNILNNERQLTIKEHTQETLNAQYGPKLKKHQQKNNNQYRFQSFIFDQLDNKKQNYPKEILQQSNQQKKKQKQQYEIEDMIRSQKQVNQQQTTDKLDRQSPQLQKIQKFKKIIQQLQTQIQEQNTKIQRLQLIKVSYEATMDDYVKRMNVLNDQVRMANHKFDHLTQAFKNLKAQMTNLQKHVKQNMVERNLCVSKQQHKTMIDNKNIQIVNKQKQIASLRTEITQKTLQIQQQLTQIKKLKQKQKSQTDNNKQIQELKTIISNLKAQISSQKVKYNLIQSQNKQVKSQISNFDVKINQIRKQINQNTEWYDIKNDQKLQNIKTYINDRKQTLKNNKQKIQELTNRLIELQKTIDDLYLQIQRKQSEIRRQKEIRNQYVNNQNLQSNQLANQIAYLNQQISKLKDNIKKLQQKIQTLQLQIGSLNAKINQQSQQIHAQSLQIQKKNTQILSLQSAHKLQLSTKQTQIQQITKNHQQLINQINNKVSDYKAQIQKSNKECIQNKVKQQVKFIKDQQTQRIRGQFEKEYRLKKQADQVELSRIRNQLDSCKQEIKKLQNQKILNKSNKRQIKEDQRFQQTSNIRSNTNRSIYMPANFRFNSDILYQHEVQKSEILLNQIQNAMIKKIKRSSLLFRYTQKNNSNLNPHILVDGKPNILLLVKLKNGQIIGGFSEKEFFRGTLSVVNWEWWGTLFNLNKNKFFYLKRQEGKRVLNWDQYYITFGNNDIRIKYGQNCVNSNFAVSSGDFDNRGQKVDSLLGCGKIQQAQLQCYQIHQVFYYQPSQLRSHQTYLLNSTALIKKIEQLTQQLDLSSQQTSNLKLTSERQQKQLSFLQKQKASSQIQTRINQTKKTTNMNQSLSNASNSFGMSNMNNGYSEYFYGEIMKNESQGRGFLIESILKLLEYGKVIDTQLVFRKGINAVGMIKKVRQLFSSNPTGMSACLFILKTKKNQRLGIYCTSFNNRTKKCYLFNINSKKVFHPSKQCLTANEDGFKFDPSITRLVFGTNQLEIKGSSPDILYVNIDGGMGAMYFEIKRQEFIEERLDQVQIEEVEAHNVLISMTKEEQEILVAKLPEENKNKKAPTIARGFRELE